MFISVEKKKTTVEDEEPDVVSDSEIFDDDNEDAEDELSAGETEDETGIAMESSRLSSMRLSTTSNTSTPNTSNTSSLTNTTSSLNAVVCDCNNQCKTTRCRCKLAKALCTQLCHLNNLHTNCSRMTQN